MVLILMCGQASNTRLTIQHWLETLRIVCLKYPYLDMIQRIHLRCVSFGSIIRLWILVKKRNIRFRIKNPDLDFSKETHLCSASTGVSQTNFSSSHTSDKVSANWTECCKKWIPLRSRILIFLTICRKFHLLVHPRENNFLTVLPIFRRQH